MTGFFELIFGVLLILYGQTPGPVCPVGMGGCPPPPYLGLYDAVGFVFVIMGSVQIAASVHISRTHSPTHHAVANNRETYRTR